MDKEFIPYEQALVLKELGFDESCFGRYYYKESYPMLNPNSGETELVFEFGQYIKQTEITILAPLFQQAFRWFREKYKYLVSPFSTESEEGKVIYYFEIGKVDKFTVDIYSDDKSTYEEAELACLKKLIEIVKNATKE